MKKVSVVMPVYNGEEYISDSIQSIINQSYDEWELIIVNEYGSSEAVTKIINGFSKKDDRIIVIQNSKKEGIAESLNIGLRKATGEYIARMDSDDISGVDRFKKQVEYLDNNKHIGLCGIQPEFFGTEKIYWKLENDPLQIRSNIFFYTPCVHPTIMFRREIIDKYKIYYNKDYKANEDYDFFSRVISVADIANINDSSLFKYRMYANNATNRNNVVGIKIYSEVMKNCFKDYLDLNFSDEEINLLDCHISMENKNGKELYESIVKLDVLLKKILLKTKNNFRFNTELMFNTLKKRWQELRWSIKEKNKSAAVNFIIDKSIFNRDSFCVNNKIDLKKADITVLLPVYKSEKYILDSVLSLIDQTYKNFIIYVMIEFDNDDNTEEYLSLLNDNRIKIIKNKVKLGLAKTLNEGIKKAKTEFIARMDSDDLSIKERFEKERTFLLNHKDVALVSSWQRHFGNFGLYVHGSVSGFEDLAASLLFKCDVCHSTVMFRKNVMVDNDYYYDPNMAMEDFDLWNRMLVKEKIYCIPEVLGEYRIHGENITQAKHQKVIESEEIIISRSLERLGIEKGSYDKRLVIGWDNIYKDYPELIKEAKKLFKRILTNNKKYKIYNQVSLEKALFKRISWMNGKYEFNVKEDYSSKKSNKFKSLIKKLLRPFINPFYSRLMYRVENRIAERNDELAGDYKYRIGNLANEIKDNAKRIDDLIVKIDKLNSNYTSQRNEDIMEDNFENYNKVIDYIKVLESRLKNNDIISNNICNYVKYDSKVDDKVRVGIIFQIASFWPSLESVYEKLRDDERFKLKFYYLNQIDKEPSQMVGAEAFLKQNNIEYEYLSVDKIKIFNPHAIIMLSPYDEWHRSKEYHSDALKNMGIRLIYIPYGIEIGGSQESLKYQYGSDFFNNMWRIYTLSEVTQKYYCLYSKKTLDDVKAYGHPKFDGLVNNKFTTNYNFKKLAKGKKIVLVKIHFPIVFNGYVVTPDYGVYIDLLNHIDDYKDVYFIFMLHPLLYDDNKNGEGKKLVEKVNNTQNIFVFKDEDYREVLLSSDAFICDRSSLAVEVGSLGKPVLFMENGKNKEILINEFDKMFLSYKKGISYGDMKEFLNEVLNNIDLNKEIRDIEVHKCIHLCDGKASNRIVDDIYEGITKDQ